MYFTDGPLLEYERMMRETPKGYHIIPVSSNSLLRPGQTPALEQPAKEVEENECRQ